MVHNKRVLITGGNGFIGRNLAVRLLSLGNHIATIQRNSSEFFAEEKLIKCFIGDLGDSEFVEESICAFQPEIVFHLAANKRRNAEYDNLGLYLNDNLMTSLNLFNSIKRNQCAEHVILLGSIEEYGYCETIYNELMVEKPNSNYGVSKFFVTKLADFFFRVHNLPMTIVRPSIVYGPHQGNDMFIPSIINTLLEGKPFPMTSGEQTRDFIYISDLVDLLVEIINVESCMGKVFNAGSDKTHKLKDVAFLTSELLGKGHLLRIGQLNHRENESMNYKVSNELLYSCCNWRPKVSLEDGLALTAQYFKSKHEK